MAQPNLFRMTTGPTIREVTAAVRTGGVEGLPDASRRGDDARYQEVVCRSALNRVTGMPFRWTLNPYRGCTHACQYCFARRYHEQLELDPGDDFSSVILVKTNVAAVLRRELARPSWTREQIAVGTATDPYQPIEGQYRLTRSCLEVLASARTPVGLVTKGPMVIRDRDVLQSVSAQAECTVYVSIPTVDEDAWRQLEPGTASPHQRLLAVRSLASAGIRTGVLIAPVVPGLTSHPAKLARTIAAAADHGAESVGAFVLHLKAGTRTHFLRFLKREHPALLPGYRRLFGRGAYASRRYTDEVRRIVRDLRHAHGL